MLELNNCHGGTSTGVIFTKNELRRQNKAIYIREKLNKSMGQQGSSFGIDIDRRTGPRTDVIFTKEERLQYTKVKPAYELVGFYDADSGPESLKPCGWLDTLKSTLKSAAAW